MNEKNQSVWMEENRSNREDSSWTKESGDSANSLKTDDNVSPDISAAQEASVARGETKVDNAEECRREAQTPLEHGAIVGTAMSPGNVSPSQGSPMSSGSVSSSQGSSMPSGSITPGPGSPMQSGSASPSQGNPMQSGSVSPSQGSPMQSGSVSPSQGTTMPSGSFPPGQGSPMSPGSIPSSQGSPRSQGSVPSSQGSPMSPGSVPSSQGSPMSPGSVSPSQGSPMSPGNVRPGQGNVVRGGYRTQGYPPKEDTAETKCMKDNFNFFGPVAFLYAVFYVFCMFRNGSGITYPFFVGGSLLFLRLSLSKLGITLKKGSVFYIAAMVLLGISTFCTDDGRIIFFNKLGCFLLMMSFLLKQFRNTQGWKLGKFLGSICAMAASLGEWNRPIADASAYRKSGARKMDKRIWYAGLGLLVGIPLMLIVLLLLASADAVFRQMTKGLLENITIYNIFCVLLQMTLVYFGSYALIAWLCRGKIKEEVVDRRTGEPVLAITITGLLTALYILFCIIQIAGLFLGRLNLPAGYTYAKYAREGFFQLLVVSILNLVLVLLCMSYFRESRVLKGILTVMSLCTFIMIASSAMRMIIYIRYYYLTFMRILVLWTLTLLAVLFAGVIINIFKEAFPLFRYSMAVVAVLYLVLSFAHPDYIIAKVNVANASHAAASWEQSVGQTAGGRNANNARQELDGERFFLTSLPYEDYAYLRKLSADAAPVLVPYLKELGYQKNAFYEENAVTYAKENDIRGKSYEVDGFGYDWMLYIQRATKNFGIRTFNLSRFRALMEFAQW